MATVWLFAPPNITDPVVDIFPAEHGSVLAENVPCRPRSDRPGLYEILIEDAICGIVYLSLKSGSQMIGFGWVPLRSDGELSYVFGSLAEAETLAPPPQKDKSKTIGRPRKGQIRVTINARMFDETQRHPESKYWSLRQWADWLSCSTGAVGKAPTWIAIMKIRNSQKEIIKSTTPMRYDK